MNDEPSVIDRLARIAALVLQQHFVMNEPSLPVVTAAGAGLVSAAVA
jgi:hypothetical protein